LNFIWSWDWGCSWGWNTVAHASSLCCVLPFVGTRHACPYEWARRKPKALCYGSIKLFIFWNCFC